MTNTKTTEPKRSVWTRAEWLKVITYIHEKNPQLNLGDESALVRLRSIKPKMVEAAMHAVIDKWRFRSTFQIASFAKSLEEAIRDLHEVLSLKAQEEKEKEPVVEEVESVETDDTIGPDSLVDPYQAAFSPLIQLIAAEVTKQMEPRMSRLEQMLQELLNRDSVTSEQKEQAISGFGAMERRTLQTRKPRIAVVGILPIQELAIKNAYPNVQFIFVEKGPTGVMSTVQNCDRVIGMTKFLNHATDGLLRKGLGSKYVRITGGPSEVKRLVELWLNSGVIPNGTAKETQETK